MKEYEVRLFEIQRDRLTEEVEKLQVRLNKHIEVLEELADKGIVKGLTVDTLTENKCLTEYEIQRLTERIETISGQLYQDDIDTLNRDYIRSNMPSK